MKILKSKIHKWYEGYMNDPTILILVDNIPDVDTMLHEKVSLDNCAVYISELEGYVHHLIEDYRDKNGFGGREFTIKVNDSKPIEKVAKTARGENAFKQVTLVGPFSGDSTVVMNNSDIECFDISITDEPEAFEKGYTVYSGMVTMEVAREAAAMIHKDLEFSFKLNDINTKCYYIEKPDKEKLGL